MKKLLLVIITITLLFLPLSCENKKPDIIVAKLTMVLDDLYDVQRGDTYPFGRVMLLKYKLINNTSNRYFLPMNDYYGYKSKVQVSLLNNMKLHYYEIADECMTYNVVDKKTGNQMIMGGYYIEPNDTGFLYFRIRRIRLRKGEDCLMPTKKLLKALSMHYELDSADMSPDSLPVPKVVFVNDTNDITVYYKMPPLKLEKK